MIKCSLCKSKMPEELFVPAFGLPYEGDLCPICTMTRINQFHGVPLGTLPTGEIAGELVNRAWEYYRPKGENIYQIKGGKGK